MRREQASKGPDEACALDASLILPFEACHGILWLKELFHGINAMQILGSRL